MSLLTRILFPHIRTRFDCLADRTTRIYPTGRIVNLRGDREAIKIGPNTHIRGEVLTFRHGGTVEIGGDCYVGEQTRIWSAGHIAIGDRVLVSHMVTIIDNLTHPLEPGARHRQFMETVTAEHPLEIDLAERPVEIADDAWIGAHSVILPGVTIGKAAVVGAGSVVTKNVEPYTVVAGNPARAIKVVPRHD